MRRWNFWIALAAQLSVTKIVSKQNDDIRLFDSRSNNSLLIDQNSNQISFKPGLSEDIKTLIRNCLKVDPKDRAEAQNILDSPVFSYMKKTNSPKEESIKVNNEIINRQVITENSFKKNNFKKKTVKAKTNIYQNVVSDKVPVEIIYSNASFKKKKDPSINKIKNETKKQVIKYSASKDSKDFKKDKKERLTGIQFFFYHL